MNNFHENYNKMNFYSFFLSKFQFLSDYNYVPIINSSGKNMGKVYIDRIDMLLNKIKLFLNQKIIVCLRFEVFVKFLFKNRIKVR